MKEVHITLLGKENLPLYYPIIEFNSEEVYVLGSRQNLAVAHNLKKVLEEKGLLCKVYCDINAFDIKSIISKCEEIHSKIGNDCNVTYNITGGTKIMLSVHTLWQNSIRQGLSTPTRCHASTLTPIRPYH